jgi:WD40 repeat protein
MSGEELIQLKHHGRGRYGLETQVSEVAFSLDGTRLATCGSDATARLWDSTTGEEHVRVTHPLKEGMLRLALSPDSTSLATASSTDKQARVWDLATKEEMFRLSHDKPLKDILYSPDGKLLVTVANDSTARIWDSSTGEELARLTHKGVACAALSPRVDRLAVATGNYVQMWAI